MSRTVVPVEGRWLNDVPAVEHECTDPRCVESGAFTVKAKPKPSPRARTPKTTPEPTEQVGSSDSQEA
jgi:hypothetical protein